MGFWERFGDVDWGDAPAWAAAAIAVLALIISAWSAALSWKSLKWERQGVDAAVRSAEAAERANRITEQLVERQLEERARPADQQIQIPGIPSEEAFGTPTVTQTPPDVRWQIEHPGGNRYVLRNIGTAVAEHVEVDESAIGAIARNVPRDAVIRPGEGHDILLLGAWGAPIPNQLYIRWGAQQDWIAIPIPN